MHAEACSTFAGLLRQQAEQAATALGALPFITLADVKTHVSWARHLTCAHVLDSPEAASLLGLMLAIP